jgi:phosphoribosylformylglycinamidine synthase
MRMLLVGPEQSANLAGSAYQRVVQGSLGGRPTRIDADDGNRSIELAIRITHVIAGAVLHDVSQGGALLAAVELLIEAGVGAHIRLTSAEKAFGEDPHRFLCVVPPTRTAEVRQLAGEVGCEVQDMGITGGTDLVIDNGTSTRLPLKQLRANWAGAIAGKMQGAVHE